MKILICESLDYSQKAIESYSMIGNVVVADLDRNTLIQTIKDFNIIVVRLRIVIDKDVFVAAPNLQYIVSPTTGTDHIDVLEAENRGVEVISLKGETEFLSSIHSTAEHTWALLFSLVRNVTSASKDVLKGNWNRDAFKGHNFFNKKIAILGLGRVGKQVAKIATAFEMNVGYYDPYVTLNTFQKFESLEEILEWGDIVSIHIPLNNSTINLLNKSNLKFLNQDSYVINTSRSGIWDESEILELLECGKISGVATDVISNETNINQMHPMIKFAEQNKGNLLITPHIAGATYESMQLTEQFLAKKLRRIVETKFGF